MHSVTLKPSFPQDAWRIKKTIMTIDEIFGTGEDLTPLQVAVRASIMFFIALVLVRLGGIRIFGQKTAFDNVMAFMMGALMVRGIANATPFLSAVAGVVAMVVIYRILAWLAMKHSWVGMIVKGYHRNLYRNGKIDERNMSIAQVSKDDLLESVRLEINSNKLEDAEEAYIEKNGRISVIEKEK
jgi:uncharacterized membrane protein YcaP (DUF421 family)